MELAVIKNEVIWFRVRTEYCRTLFVHSFFVHDVTRSESFRNSKSSGNFLRQSKHDFNQVTISEGIWNFAGYPTHTPRVTQNVTQNVIQKLNWFSHLGPSKCLRNILWTIENVLRMCWGCENSMSAFKRLDSWVY